MAKPEVRGRASHERFFGEIAGQPEISTETGLNLKKLWHEFGFPGEPPMSGTPVEARLISKCEQYAHFVSNPRLKGATGSDEVRRAVHKEIAMMVFGQQFDNLDFGTREALGEFACRLSTGLSTDELGILASEDREAV